MIVIIGLVIVAAAVIGVMTDSLCSGARLAWAHRETGEQCRARPGYPGRAPGAETAETTAGPG
jgi:hypothetical protein